MAKSVAEFFGGEISIKQAWDDADESMIGVLAASDSPSAGLTSYSTIGLCDSEIHDHVGVVPYRVELVMAARSQFEKTRNILATAAFHVINSDWSCHCFALYPGIVEMYYPDSPMAHLLFVDPFMWDGEFPELNVEGLPLRWLLAAPISEPERRYAINFDIPTLLDELDECGADVTDLYRSSVA
ncbi:MAG: suppressor of fused domain protein [Planctomycetota bacterium]|nr:suppressor of fused domain protein [Planctomycetota bacterium]